jgi:type I restriction enzyme S subunit
VTTGLVPSIAKISGPAIWGLEAPAHWQVKRLKFVTPHVTVGIVVNPSSYYVDFGVPCLRSLNVEAGELLEKDLVFIDEKSHHHLSKSAVYCGDIVAVRTGQPGTAAVIDARFDNANCIDLIIIRRSRHFVPDYLQHLLNSNFVLAQFESGSDGAIQQHFNIQTAKNLVVLVPPMDEQQQIVDFIGVESGKIDAIVACYARQIELLSEYRSALIHETVTGQHVVATSKTDIPEAA